MSSTLHINYNKLRRVTHDAAIKLLRDVQRRTLNAAKLRSPVDTGQLRASHRPGAITVKGDVLSVDVTAEQEYALAVHEGSRPHVIRPRRAKVLSWKGPQGRVFAREVHHPGAKPRPWLLNAAQAEGPRLGFEVTPSL